MVGNVIQNLFTSTGDYAAAGALSVILMAVIVGMVMVYVRTSGTEDLV
jgi:spermidine/putrescine transport system permease protein